MGAGFTAVRAPHAMAAGGCALSRPSLAQDFEEADLLRRLNEYRTRNGLGALALSPALMAAAAWKSTDLGANAYFSHDDLFRSWLQRLRDCGYTASVNVAENLAAGNADAASTFAQWQSSSGHNVNMLNPSMRVVGIARAFSASSPYGWYWTADFAAVADGDVAAASPPPAAPAGGHGAVTADGAATTSSSGAAPALNATVVVSGTGDCLRVHDAPTIGANVVGCLPDGTAMIVSAGPISADGYTWWKLGALGWAAGQYLAAGQ
ncbi:MAG TPA: CAP domain-containing protein [Dehalococcoidia bacterium]|nr:CAP domain-containing protein [Dehalococcoidia bacterium]